MEEEEIEKGDCGPPTRKVFFEIFRTWTKRYLITSQTRVKRISRIHHQTIFIKMVRWSIRLLRLTLVCEVIRYRLVKVRQNLKKATVFAQSHLKKPLRAPQTLNGFQGNSSHEFLSAFPGPDSRHHGQTLPASNYVLVTQRRVAMQGANFNIWVKAVTHVFGTHCLCTVKYICRYSVLYMILHFDKAGCTLEISGYRQMKIGEVNINDSFGATQVSETRPNGRSLYNTEEFDFWLIHRQPPFLARRTANLSSAFSVIGVTTVVLQISSDQSETHVLCVHFTHTWSASTRPGLSVSHTVAVVSVVVCSDLIRNGLWSVLCSANMRTN